MGYRLSFRDWLALDTKPDVYEGGTDKHFIATAYYAYSTSLLRKVAEILGKIQMLSFMLSYMEILFKRFKMNLLHRMVG